MKKILLFVSIFFLLALLTNAPVYADVYSPTKTSFQFIKDGTDVTKSVNFTLNCRGCSAHEIMDPKDCNSQNANIASSFELDCVSNECFTTKYNQMHYNMIILDCSLKGELSGVDFEIKNARIPDKTNECEIRSQYSMARSYSENGQTITKYYNYSTAWNQFCTNVTYEEMEANGCFDLNDPINIAKYLIELDPNTFEKDEEGYPLHRFCTFSYDLTNADFENSEDGNDQEYTDSGSENENSNDEDFVTHLANEEEKVLDENGENNVNSVIVYAFIGALIFFNILVIVLIAIIVKLRKKIS